MKFQVGDVLIYKGSTTRRRLVLKVDVDKERYTISDPDEEGYTKWDADMRFEYIENYYELEAIRHTPLYKALI